jgi:hypothetical protein
MTFAQQIELLLGQATREGMYRHRSTGVLSTKAYVGVVGPGTYVAHEEEIELVSEPAVLLERLYAAADAEPRRLFARILVESLSLANARVVARTLVVTHHLGVLGAGTRLDAVGEELWRGLVHVLRFESSRFRVEDLDAVEVMAAHVDSKATAEACKEYSERVKMATRSAEHLPSRSIPSGGSAPVTDYRPSVPLNKVLEEVRSVVSRVRYLRLAKEIRENRNPTIDADRQILLSRLQAMGFSDHLSNASNEIEHRAATETTNTGVKTVMDLLRTFFEEFTEEACRKAEGKVGRPAPSGPAVNHFQPYRKYLENEGFIGPEESALWQVLYNFLSNQGAHKLGSAPEQLKVAHATVIEWCMLVAGRIKAYLS